MSWLKRNAGSVEAIAASVTVMVAVAALVGIKWQLDGAEQLQAAQSARDAYRAHLALAATIPDFAAPQDGCWRSRTAGTSPFFNNLTRTAISFAPPTLRTSPPQPWPP